MELTQEVEKLGGRIISETVARTLADCGIDVVVATRADGGNVFVVESHVTDAYDLLLEMVIDGACAPAPWDRRSWQASLLESDIPRTWPSDAAFDHLRAWTAQLSPERVEQIMPALDAVLRTGDSK